MTRTVAHYTDAVAFGGAEQALLLLLRALDRRRWRPVLLHHGSPGLRPLLDGAREAGVTLHDMPLMRGPLRTVLRMPAFAAALRRLRPAVFHAHLNWPLACTGGLLCSGGVPAVLATVQLFGPLPPSPTLALQRRLVTRRVDQYIAVSEGVARRLYDELGLPERQVCVIPNAVDLDRHRAPSEPGGLRGVLGVPPGRPLVLTLARLSEQKGLSYLLRAAVHVPEAAFAVAGEGPGRAALEAEAAALGVADRVRFLGHREDAPALLAACDLFALPSLYEGLPLSVLEAMAAGKAVVATAIPGVDEAVADGTTGLLVPPADPEALAEAVRALLADPARRLRLGAAGAERARTHFATASTTRAVEAAYERVLSGKT